MRHIQLILILFLCSVSASAQGTTAASSLRRYVKAPPLMPRDDLTSGVVVSGTIGSSGTVFRSDAGLEIQHPTFALLSIFNSANPPTRDDSESAIAFGMRNSEGTIIKPGSIFAKCVVCTPTNFVGKLGFNATYGTGGQSSVFLVGFGTEHGDGSAQFFSNSTEPIPERQLYVNGDIKLIGKILDINDKAFAEKGTWTPVLHGFTIVLNGGFVTTAGTYSRVYNQVTVRAIIYPQEGATVAIPQSCHVSGLPSSISGGSTAASGKYSRADAITDGGVLVDYTDLFMTTASNASPAMIVISATYLIP